LRQTVKARRYFLARFIQEKAATVIPFEDHHWPIAIDAFLRFGKGRHQAGLNFGDCLTYAVARVADQPLLCLGDDFAQTDLELVQQ
jgi:ribonuclease VapC